MGNLIRSAEGTSLTLECPSCRATHQDYWECLVGDEFASICCSACNRPFYFYLKDCLVCGNESVYTWIQSPTNYVIDILGCQFCGETFDDRADPTRNAPPIV